MRTASNLRKDPDEFHNLASVAEFQSIRKELEAWLPKNIAPEFKKRSERERRR